MLEHSVDVRSAISPIDPPPGVDRMLLTIAFGPLAVDHLVLPLYGRLSPGGVARLVLESWGREPRAAAGDVAAPGRESGWLGYVRRVAVALSSERWYRHPRKLVHEAWGALARALCARRLSAASTDAEYTSGCPDRAAALIARCRTDAQVAVEDPATTQVVRALQTRPSLRRAQLAGEATAVVPILMYHRISDRPLPGLERWSVSPADFDQQLWFLRWLGYHSISSSDLLEAIRARRPLPGRPVLLTFDDGYGDFYETAWPILRERGFSADVFIVTGSVGGHAEWDRQDGEAAPLMSWQQIAQLREAGVTFGSHLSTHRPAPTLPTEELLQEGAASRFALESRLKTDVRAVSVPYGGYDARVIATLRWCGYEIGFTTRNRLASVYMHPMTLPRLEVVGGEGIEAFAAKLGRMRELRQWQTRVR